MFCTKCGAQNPDGSAFCVSCGNSLQPAGGQGGQPQVQYSQPEGYAPQPNYTAQPNAYPYPQRKSNKGLIIGLVIGGVVLIAGIVVLIVLLTGGSAAGSGIVGTWYEQTGFGGTMTFNANGTVDMNIMGQTVSGDYTYDANSKNIAITIMGETVECYLDGDTFSLEGAEYSRNKVEQMDLSDFDLSDFGLDQ